MILRLCRTSGMTFAEAMIIISIVVVLVAIAIPNFVKARISTSIHSCKYNLMWMEYAKEDWTRQTQASAGAQILDRDLIAAMNRARPRWDGREQKEQMLSSPPRCFIGGRHLIGKVGERPSCSTGTNVWDEALYQSSYYGNR